MKKISLIIAGVLTLSLVIGLAIQAGNYYNNTYQTSKAYTKAPLKVPDREETKDDSGKVIKGSYSYQYHFEFVTTEGTKKSIAFELSGENVTPFKPGEFLEAEVSNTRVVYGPNGIKQSKIPKSVLKKISVIE
ncbi:DUF1093 domain-containing protein [Leuconostoc koreense]|nr:DUF1093 domain-containing protein [Leuconostoc mesenteroides]QGM25756.1 DUF1093 domain-containing protein [Leuconostoc mesenteroides subsp. mesenteroides]